MRHAIRIYDTVEEKQKLTKADLATLAEEDITKSRVFEEVAYGDIPESAEDQEGRRERGRPAGLSDPEEAESYWAVWEETSW